VSPKSPSASHQDDTFEVILLESTSEAERRAKLRQSAAGKYQLKFLFFSIKNIF
jgi:hypothetical protein